MVAAKLEAVAAAPEVANEMRIAECEVAMPSSNHHARAAGPRPDAGKPSDENEDVGAKVEPGEGLCCALGAHAVLPDEGSRSAGGDVDVPIQRKTRRRRKAAAAKLGTDLAAPEYAEGDRVYGKTGNGLDFVGYVTGESYGEGDDRSMGLSVGKNGRLSSMWLDLQNGFLIDGRGFPVTLCVHDKGRQS